jgi:hypothetical protein
LLTAEAESRLPALIADFLSFVEEGE